MILNYDEALEFATKKHLGQYRVGGKPYITHPIEVAEILRNRKSPLEYQIAGLFHDLLEDTDATVEEILHYGGPDVLEAVKLLTKSKDYVMDEYITNIKNNKIAREVKIADRLHNLLSATVCSEEFKRRYILETIDYYIDLDKEIGVALKNLISTLKTPLYKNSLSYDTVQETEFKEDTFIVKGDICYSKNKEEFATIEDGYLVCVNGISKGCFKTIPEEYKDLKVLDYSNKLVIPALVDLHIHAPQYAFRGTDMDMELMDWLSNHTFPEESKYHDMSYASIAYSIFADAMKKSATGYACVFATKHRKATELLMDLLDNTGVVSYVGKVNMDREAPEALLEESADYAAFDTYGWINNVINKYKNTKPILTPRFIPCCTPDLLKELREIQLAYDLPVQSHLSENKGEIEFVRQLAPSSAFYGDAYDEYSMFGYNHLNNKFYKAIMAHCVYSTEEEMLKMKENGVFVAHCPSSNMNLSSGIAPIRKYLNLDLNLGLGSDVAGGHSESMLRAVCDAVQVSKLYWRLIDENYKPLTFKEAFYLATIGGGEFFGKVGSLDKDYECSFVVLDDSINKFPNKLSINQRIESAAYSSIDLYGVCAKFIRGNKVYEKE